MNRKIKPRVISTAENRRRIPSRTFRSPREELASGIRFPELPPPQMAPSVTSDPTLDDAATLLMQLEPSDANGFARLRDLLTALGNCNSMSGGVRAMVLGALERVEGCLDSSLRSAEDVLIEVSVLLEKASNSADSTDEVEGGVEPLSESESMPGPAGGCVSGPPSGIPAIDDVAQRPFPENLPADNDPDLLGEFIVESREFLERAESSLLTLETDPQNVEAVNTIFRAFHTIKGTSAFLGLSFLSELAHLAESLLSRVREKEISCTGGYADLALQALDMLKALVQNTQEALAGRPLVRPQGYEELKAMLRAPEASGISEAVKPSGSFSLPLEDDLLVEAEAALGDTTAAAEIGTEPRAVIPPMSPGVVTLKSGKEPDSSVRVSTSRLDLLIDTVGELVIAQSMVAQDGTVLNAGHYNLLKKVAHTGKIVRELQDLSMSMRMVPLKATFQKMGRLVRDLAHKGGKRVNLVTEDRDAEIDRNMVDIINDLLVHTIRNAVDHGIEPPEVRETCGKDPTGTVILSASHAGGNVVVEIRDDGKGLDREKIRAKAISRGLVESSKVMSDNEIDNLIFAPGFSTADQVTDISGRGVGMDVVRKGLETLRGRIDIYSEMGKGCSFVMRLPLTLAITDGMLIRVGVERYIIPTASIQLAFRPQTNSLSTIAGRGEMVMLRGELMPLFRLHRLFKIRGAVEDPMNGLLVVLGDGDRRCTLLVDGLLGQQQVVAKSLGDGLGKVQGVSGAAILGDGRVGLILDPGEILALARQSQTVNARELESQSPAA